MSSLLFRQVMFVCSLSSGVWSGLVFDRRVCGRAGFSYLYSIPLFPPRAPGLAARGDSSHRKFREVANPPSGINASIQGSLSPLPRRTRPF